MSSLLSKIPAASSEPAKTYQKAPGPAAVSLEVPKPPDRHPSSQDLSSSEVAYVKSLMGLLPAQKMNEVLLRTGVPMPVNLGLDVDTTA